MPEKNLNHLNFFDLSKINFNYRDDVIGYINLLSTLVNSNHQETLSSFKDFLSKEKYYVYVIINPSNQKRYIGMTTNINRRYNQHLNALKKGVHSNTSMQKDFNKIGSFKFKILEECFTYEDSLYIEREYIQEFHTDDPLYGYNYNGFTSQARSVATLKGLHAAQLQGRKGGRPKKKTEHIQSILEMYSQNFSIAHIVKVTGLSRTTIYRVINENKNTHIK